MTGPQPHSKRPGPGSPTAPALPSFERRLEGRCWLCGDPTDTLCCPAHKWAEQTPVPVQLGLTDLHGYWLEQHTPLEIVELAEELER